MLHKKNVKTGFFSSPHLVAARERIRINEEPISEKMFTLYFYEVYNKLSESVSAEEGMPSYFHFMTLMAFRVFIAEKVDAAILEVGIGGEFDCTNVVPQPVVTGVTSLDLDHCSLLGDTIESIAWHKGGIFKNKVVAFTVRQNEKAFKVLQDRASQVNAPLFISPSWSLYLNSSKVNLSIKGNIPFPEVYLDLTKSHIQVKFNS